MYCRKCGKEINPDTVVCPNCEHVVEEYEEFNRKHPNSLSCKTHNTEDEIKSRLWYAAKSETKNYPEKENAFQGLSSLRLVAIILPTVAILLCTFLFKNLGLRILAVCIVIVISLILNAIGSASRNKKGKVLGLVAYAYNGVLLALYLIAFIVLYT